MRALLLLTTHSLIGYKTAILSQAQQVFFMLYYVRARTHLFVWLVVWHVCVSVSMNGQTKNIKLCTVGRTLKY